MTGKTYFRFVIFRNKTDNDQGPRDNVVHAAILSTFSRQSQKVFETMKFVVGGSLILCFLVLFPLAISSSFTILNSIGHGEIFFGLMSQ